MMKYRSFEGVVLVGGGKFCVESSSVGSNVPIIAFDSGGIAVIESASIGRVDVEESPDPPIEGFVGVREGDDFRNRQTNRTFLNTKSSATKQRRSYFYH
jgi:hypothetical protein